jgi:hypothetical protein
LVGLIVAIIIGLGRQLTVFLVVERTIGIFRNFTAKRNVGVALVAVLCGTALILEWNDPGVSASVLVMSIVAVVLSLFAILFNLEGLFPALDEVHVAVPEATNAQDDLPVVVVEIETERRAYPLERMIMARHLVHDRLGDLPIVLTYCALCRSGLVYRSAVDGPAPADGRATADGRELTFRVVGIFRRNLIMEDVQTRTLWQQATGVAIHGPLAGHTLEMLPSEQTLWGKVRNRPGMTLGVAPGSADHAPFATTVGLRLLKTATDRIITPGRRRLSNELPPRETVFGIRIDGAARAYPRSDIESAGTFEDHLNGVPLQLEYNPDTDNLSVHRMDGRPDPVVERHWWLGWNEFHPDTTVYKQQE